MRMLLRVSVPVETGNALTKAGTLGSTVEKILADLKLEAAYFFVDDNGNRSNSIVFDMKDSSQMPAIAAFNANVSFRPVIAAHREFSDCTRPLPLRVHRLSSPKPVSLTGVFAHHIRLGFRESNKKTSVPISSPNGHGRQGVLFGRRSFHCLV